MYTLYKSTERSNTFGSWGTSAETFFGSDQEKFLGFGNLVQLTHSTLNVNQGNSGMKLHRNMEIVDIILKGSVGFQDSFGETSTFPENTIQAVSAGKGIYQNEFNAGLDESEKIQIGFLPNSLNKTPVKTKALFDLHQNSNSLVELVSPRNPSSLSVRQQAAVLMGEFEPNQHIGYAINSKTIGLFVYTISGVVTVQNEILRRGDSVGIINEEQTLLHTAEQSKILVIEVSLND